MTVITQGGVVLDDKENRLLDQAIKILELEARVASSEAREDKLEARVDKLEARQDKLEARQDKHEARVAELEAKLEAHEEMIQNLDERIVGISKASIKRDNEIKIVIAATASAAASKPGAAKEQTLVAHAKELEKLKEKLEAHEEMMQNLDKQL